MTLDTHVTLALLQDLLMALRDNAPYSLTRCARSALNG